MRTVRPEGPIIYVTDDPNLVISDFLGYALSLHKISGRPRAEELAERFSPEGSGMALPIFVAYRATEPDDIPPELNELSEYAKDDFDRMEIWVLTRLPPGQLSESAVVEGSELRHLLNEALAQTTGSN